MGVVVIPPAVGEFRALSIRTMSTVLWVAAAVSLGTSGAPFAAAPDDKPTPQAAQAKAKPKAENAARKALPPMVVSKTRKAELGQPPSPFLTLPGADRYDPDGLSWADVPEWRKTSFFGVRAKGQFFVYVVDCSGSMLDEDRLVRAKEEIRKAAAGLRDPQKFLVIFYNDQPIPMPGGLPRSAGVASRQELMTWLRLIEPDGETDPRGALGMALGLRPDAVFLLSDGEFPEGTVEAVAKRNPRKVPIHCVDLSTGEAADQLRRVAAESGGRYVLRPSPTP